MQIFTAFHLKGMTIVWATQDKNLIQQYPHPVIFLIRGRRFNGNMEDKTKAEA
jgi:ABC-type ATPase involved in cell division